MTILEGASRTRSCACDPIQLRLEPQQRADDQKAVCVCGLFYLWRQFFENHIHRSVFTSMPTIPDRIGVCSG